MTRFISGAKWQPIIVIDRTKRRRRTSNDVIAMTIAASVLLLAFAYAVAREFL